MRVEVRRNTSSWKSIAVTVVAILASAFILFDQYSASNSYGPDQARAPSPQSMVLKLTDFSHEGESVDGPHSSSTTTTNSSTSSANSTMDDILNKMANESAKEALEVVGAEATSEPDSGVNITEELPKELPPQRPNLGQSCDYEELRKVLKWNKQTEKWEYATKSWCNGAVEFPISDSALAKAFENKRVLFLGDSVVRNVFVLTMARLCNSENMDKCITRMPTYDYDIKNVAKGAGPMGCTPEGSAGTAAEDGSGDGESKLGTGNYAKNATSLCYKNGNFSDVYVRGLTTKFVPQDKAGRQKFLKRNLIGPALEMNYRNTTFIYLPVTKPSQLFQTGAYMFKVGKRFPYLQTDLIIASIGPHLKMLEVEYTPLTIPRGFVAIRRGTRAPVVFAEFIHTVSPAPKYSTWVDRIMIKLKNRLAQLEVDMVPQRQITDKGYLLKGIFMSQANEQRPKRGCGFYDAQHPALSCQHLAAEMLWAASIVKMMPPNSKAQD